MFCDGVHECVFTKNETIQVDLFKHKHKTYIFLEIKKYHVQSYKSFLCWILFHFFGNVMYLHSLSIFKTDMVQLVDILLRWRHGHIKLHIFLVWDGVFISWPFRLNGYCCCLHLSICLYIRMSVCLTILSNRKSVYPSINFTLSAW